VNDRTTNEGWNDFNGLTLTSLNSRAGPGGNLSNPFFLSSSFNKQTLQPRLGPHELNYSRQIFSRPKAQKSGCTHYDENKHTKDMCFQLHGYPKWWYELKGKKDERNGHATFVTNTNLNTLVSLNSQPQPSTQDPGIISSTNLVSNGERINNWISDSGATDHMTYDYNDFKTKSVPQRKAISNANGDIYPITGGGIVELSTTFILPNTLFIHSLSTKLLSVRQVKEDLNYCVPMYSSFCLFQDVLTKKIFGRGTKRGELYYVDDLDLGKVHSAQSSQRQGQDIWLWHYWLGQDIWLWHYWLGHSSFSYLQHLFPTLFEKVLLSSFKCKNCILGKSH
jgi:hypothetical protein